MSQHLTPEQIAEQMIGAAQPHDVRHARECSACGSQVARLEGALADFRGAMHNWAEHISPRETSVLHLEFRRNLFARNRTKAGLGSLALHATALASALALSSLKPVQMAVNSRVIPLFAPAIVKPMQQHSGGGGGGARQPEVKKADLPKTAPRLFTPPRTDQVEARLELPPALLDVPDSGSITVGNLTGLNVLNGTGYGGSIGAGPGGGIGPGNGLGAGPGSDGGTSGMIYKPGGDVVNPIPISQPEPQYSEEARKAKWSGMVRLSFVVDEAGRTMNIHVLKPLGLGLDQKAIDAVSKWLFKPGTKAGKPVKVYAEVEVTFRLL